MPDNDAKPIALDDVRKVATLARLTFDDADIARLAGQLQSILGYVKKIGQVDLAGVEPLAHALPLRNVLRDDVPGPALPLEAALRNAPETDGPFFKVPKVIGADEDSAG